MEIPKTANDIQPGRFDTYIYQFIEIKQNQVLYREKPITDKNRKPLPLDAPSFKALCTGYFVDKNGVYGLTNIVKSHSEKFYLTPIQNVDIASFTPINLYYAKDKSNTYFADNGKVIKGTDFAPLYRFIEDEKTQVIRLSKESIFKSDVVLNDTEVYYRGKLLKDADPKSFCQVGRKWYKDKHHVYFVDAYHITKYTDFDPDTFISFGYNATDKYTSSAEVIHNSATESLVNFRPYKEFFERNPHLNDYWYYKAKASLLSQKNKKATPIGSGFFKIDEAIYCLEDNRDKNLTRIKDANTSNFKLLEHGYATNGKSLFLIRDENWSYHLSFRQIELAPKHTLEVLSDAWAYDGSFFYYKALKKFKADRKTFKILNHIHAYDKNGLILEGVRKKGISVTKNIKSLGGAYIKIEDTTYYMGKPRKNKNIDDSRLKSINDFIIMGADGSAFDHGKYRKYIGDFEKFKLLENGNWGDGTLEWHIGPAGIEAVE